MPASNFFLEVNPKIPRKLARLADLSEDLWYSWDRQTRSLFARLDPVLWRATGHNPKLFLRLVDESRLQAAAQDRVFIDVYHRVLSARDTYLLEPQSQGPAGEFGADDLIGYFCAEYGLHESFPIYSGGLGILAGDHCKAASDLSLPFVSVGLLYRQGYFSQRIDAQGNQQADYTNARFEDLPVRPVLRHDGGEVLISLDCFPGRAVKAKLWVAEVGRIRLYLLDTNIAENTEQDRYITHRLYGGDLQTRIQQEIVLGVGGVRALRAVGLAPSVWHINEGHAAFLVLERIRELVGQGLDFYAALEAVAASTVFTTHTPVPAGHDIFPADMVREYFGMMIAECGVEAQAFLDLGAHPGEGFSMTALAVRGSRWQNGVSRIHGEVAARMLAPLWPEVPAEENPVGYVTNGVHIPSFLAAEWVDTLDRLLGGQWRNQLSQIPFWERVEQIPDHLFWSIRQTLKSQMLTTVRQHLTEQHLRNGMGEARLDRVLRHLDPIDPNVLVVGFARRFATYKRATLLFDDVEHLRQLATHSQRPIVFLFAGKAHPADTPAQELVRTIARFANDPRFLGHVHVIENYDLALARHLVSGVDVWLNNPEYPLEASGTSGEKAGANGVINLSVLDGWWGEGFNGHNGWGIKPHPDDGGGNSYHDEANEVYTLLEQEVAPLYYDRGSYGYAPGWVKMSKASMKSIIPRFNAERMVADYVSDAYRPAAGNGRRFAADSFVAAQVLSVWKSRIRELWPLVRLLTLEGRRERLQLGQGMELHLDVDLGGLNPADVVVELLLERDHEALQRSPDSYRFLPAGQNDQGQEHFVLALIPDLCGSLRYRIRIFPYHTLLTHPYEMGLMRWL